MSSDLLTIIETETRVEDEGPAICIFNYNYNMKVAYTAENFSVHIMSLDEGELQLIISTNHRARITILTTEWYREKETCLITASTDGCVYAFSIRTGRQLIKFEKHTDSILCLDTLMFKDSPCVVSGGKDYVVLLWRLLTGEVLHRLTFRCPSWITACSATDDMVVTCGATGVIVIWEFSTGKMIRQFSGHSGHSVDAAAIIRNRENSRVREFLIERDYNRLDDINMNIASMRAEPKEGKPENKPLTAEELYGQEIALKKEMERQEKLAREKKDAAKNAQQYSDWEKVVLVGPFEPGHWEKSIDQPLSEKKGLDPGTEPREYIIVSGDDSRRIIIWNAVSGQIIRMIDSLSRPAPTHAGTILCIQTMNFPTHGKNGGDIFIAVSSSAGMFWLIDLNTGYLLEEIPSLINYTKKRR